MNIRLVGSYVIEDSCFKQKSLKIADFLLKLPKHCFTQILSEPDSSHCVILVFSYDFDFDYDEWFVSFSD